MTIVTKEKIKPRVKSNIDSFGDFNKAIVYSAKVTENFGFFELSDLFREIDNERDDNVNTGDYYSGFRVEISDEISPFSIGALKTFYSLYGYSKNDYYNKMAIVSDSSMFENFVTAINSFNEYVNSHKSYYKLQYFATSERDNATEWIIGNIDESGSRVR